MEGKVGGGTHCHGGVRATAVCEGGPSVGACCGDGGRVGARVAVGHRAKRASKRDRDGERAGDANATVHNKLKRDS
jgi:hypothetical protein